jgi:hypothetical protein
MPVPFVPMRASTIVYTAITRRNRYAYLKIMASSGFGAVVRMFIMWQLIMLSAAALPFSEGAL